MKKIIKPFLFSFVFLTLVLLGIAGTMSSTYVAEQSIEINAPQAEIFNLVADFSKWKEWSPWYDYEPNAIYEIKGEPGQVSSSIRWRGNSVGRGLITIRKLENLKSIDMNFQFETPHKTEADGSFLFTTDDDTTTVTWTNRGQLEYPFGRLFGPVLQGMIQKDLLKGLENLKARAEKGSVE